MELDSLAWLTLLSICAAMVAAGTYLCFRGLVAEQKRARLIYAVVLSVYALWILPFLVKIATAIAGFNPESQFLRFIVIALEIAGIVWAIRLSGRHHSHVFRIICASIGVIAGLVIGVFLRLAGIGTGQVLTIAVPVVLAAGFGLYGWSRGADIRNSGKILSFSVTGSGLAASGLTTAAMAWFSDQPGEEICDLALSIVSPGIKYILLGFPSLLEILLSLAIWILFVVAGMRYQCRSLQARERDQSSICAWLLKQLKLS